MHHHAGRLCGDFAPSARRDVQMAWAGWVLGWAKRGWPSRIGRGLGDPLAGCLDLLAHERSRPPAPERCSFGPDRAQYYSSFFNFQNPLILSIFQKSVPTSKIRRNLYTIYKNAKQTLSESS
jgi:hypothetical protein